MDKRILSVASKLEEFSRICQEKRDHYYKYGDKILAAHYKGRTVAYDEAAALIRQTLHENESERREPVGTAG